MVYLFLFFSISLLLSNRMRRRTDDGARLPRDSAVRRLRTPAFSVVFLSPTTGPRSFLSATHRWTSTGEILLFF